MRYKFPRYDMAPRSNPGIRQNCRDEIITGFLPFPYLPDDLLTAEDWEKAKSDTRRRRTLVVGDPVSNDYGNEIAQIDTIAHELAAKRLGLYGVTGELFDEISLNLLPDESMTSTITMASPKACGELSKQIGGVVLSTEI
jgi:hypothetical protein